jgi:hypothetical protein
VPRLPQKVYLAATTKSLLIREWARWTVSPVSRFGIRGSDFTLVVKILSSRCSCVQPVDIPAVVNLAQIVKVPERQRIEVFDLRISLERQGEDILDGV